MRQTTRLLSAVLIASLVGCALPAHNNTLIFSVNRKVGIDITPTNATNAGLTIGYASNEFAWVPLWANDGDGKPMLECPAAKGAVQPTRTYQDAKNNQNTTTITPYCSSKVRFVGKESEFKEGEDEDSLSVFASFGGSVAAKAGADQPTASLNIASFFATGIAAQNLSNKGSSLVAVADASKKTEPSETPAFKDARNSLTLLLTMTASKADKKSVVNEKCLTILSAKFDGKSDSQRFTWVKERTPSAATKALLLSDWSEVELQKLSGEAYQLAKKAEAKIDSAETTAKDKTAAEKEKAMTDATKTSCDDKPASASNATKPTTLTSLLS